MAKQGYFEIEGEVQEALPNTLFRVLVKQAPEQGLVGKVILCHISGKMRMRYVRILPGDMVRAEMTPYDLDKGRITARAR